MENTDNLKCAVCNENYVDADSGYDTCDECLNEV